MNMEVSRVLDRYLVLFVKLFHHSTRKRGVQQPWQVFFSLPRAFWMTDIYVFHAFL